jgi:hypothetical protein
MLIIVGGGVFLCLFLRYKIILTAIYKNLYTKFFHFICRNCRGNGYIRVTFEAEEHIHQCDICKSEGILKGGKYYVKAIVQLYRTYKTKVSF